LAAAGGFQAVQTANAGRFDFWHASSSSTGWPMLLWLGPAFFLSPGLIQKAYGARDERALTRGIALNGVALILFAFVPVALGLSARALFPDLPRDDLALPTILASVPLVVGGLAMAAVFSAEMSAADAVLFMLSTSGARDLYKSFLRPDATDRDVLRVARITAVLGGALGYALTFVFPTVYDALKMFYSILVVTLFAPVLGGLYLPRAGRGGAFAAIVVGVAVLVATQFITGGNGYGWASPTFLGLAASSATYVVLAVF
jgi:SSS family solute:Na+ symporter